MKTLFTTLLLAVLAITASAEQTLFDSNVRVTGFGGPSVYYTQFKGDPQVLVGGSGAVLLNSTFYLGFAGYGMASQPDAGMAQINGTLRDTHYEGGYCGGLLGVMLKSNDLIHTSADVLIGGGSVSRVRDDWEYRHHDSEEWDRNGDDEDGFFMVQPMAHLEVNTFRWMRVDAGAGYRFVNGVTHFGLDNNDVSGPVAGLNFRFGKF